MLVRMLLSSALMVNAAMAAGPKTHTPVPVEQVPPAPVPPPQPKVEPAIPHGTAKMVGKDDAVPKGWVDCAKTRAADNCTLSAEKGKKFIIKLPEDRTVDDLNQRYDIFVPPPKGVKERPDG